MQNPRVQDDFNNVFQAFGASYQTRADAEARMFKSALDPQVGPDKLLFESMRLERRREIFCIRALLYTSALAVERAQQLTRQRRGQAD